MVLCLEIEGGHAGGGRERLLLFPANRNLGPGCKDQIASKDVSSRVTEDRHPKNPTTTSSPTIFPHHPLSGFAGLLIFTQDIYPGVNSESPITDKCTFYEFVRLLSCLSPYSFLSLTLSGRLGSLNSSVNSALCRSLSWSD